MKKGWKIFWVTIAGVAILGIICGCISLALGVSVKDLDSDFDIRDVTVVEKRIPVATDGSEYQYEFQDITDLDMCVRACEVIIQTRNTDTVQIDTSELNYETLGLELFVEEKDGKLVIQTTKDGELCKGHHLKNREGGILSVYIPEDMNLSTANFELGGCVFEMSGLNIDQMSLTLGAVEGDMEHMTLHSLFAEVGAGELEYSGAITGNAEIVCGTGEVDLELSGTKEEFNYELSVGMGAIEIGEMEYGGFAMDKNIDNQAQKNMRIDCGVGNVSVDFK